jgi:hypothetical protein
MEPACLKGMKVIIRDARTQNYLSADGGWVRSRDDAGDFFTLLRAYHFAARHTSGRFQVLLYSPDDQYCANIVEGTGTAKEEHETAGNVGVREPAELQVEALCATGRNYLN